MITVWLALVTNTWPLNQRVLPPWPLTSSKGVYILVKKRFRSGVNIHRKRSFPGADIGSDHDLVMMTFRVHLKKARKPNQQRLRFDLEKLRDSDVACSFQAKIVGKFTPLIGLCDEDTDIDTMITTYNTAVSWSSFFR